MTAQDRYWPLALLPALLLAGAVLNGFLLDWAGRLLGRRARALLTGRAAVAAVAVAAVSGAFAVAVVVLVAVFPALRAAGHGQSLSLVLWEWFDVGRFPVPLALRVDPLGLVMTLVVTGVSAVIHVYSIGYMGHDPAHRRYFAYLNLFVFFMLLLVTGDNLAVVFIGWEGVGLCSYLLIGFWYEDRMKAVAGKKAFIVNRIGDLGFLLGILLVASHTGHIDFAGIRAGMAGLAGGEVLGVSTVTLACLLFFLGATGKSAQLPLFVWLPDAMAGPTPVSALIHAATMVTAGVYLIARMSFLFMASPAAMAVVALTGAVTALVAALIGFAQNDIKKVLAYSTISQLGYMFMAVGVGAFSAGIFHLVTHAFFKACLFLGAGAVIVAMHERQNIQEMGALARRIPITHGAFLASVLAIAGAPLFSGFFSKDEILWRAFAAAQTWRPWVPKLVWALGAAGAGLTAFYMFRLYFLVFRGRFRGPAELADRIHRPPLVMEIPLVVLGLLAVFGGFIGMPHVFHALPNWFEEFVGEGLIQVPVAGGALEELGVMGVGLGVGLAGFIAAWLLYGRGPSMALMKATGAIPRAYRLVAGRFYVDEAYGLLVVRPLGWAAAFCHRVGDRFIIDKVAVEGCARLAAWAGWVLGRMQGGVVHRYAWAMAAGVVLLVYVAAAPRPAADVEPLGGNRVRFTQVVPYVDALYSWDFDGDGSFELRGTPLAVVEHAYPSAGSYTAVCRARSRWGFERERRFDVVVLAGREGSAARRAGAAR